MCSSRPQGEFFKYSIVKVGCLVEYSLKVLSPTLHHLTEADRQRQRQAGRQTDRQTERETDRQTDVPAE